MLTMLVPASRDSSMNNSTMSRIMAEEDTLIAIGATPAQLIKPRPVTPNIPSCHKFQS